MSRYYNMAVTVTGADPARVKAVKEAAENEWSLGDWCGNDDSYSSSGDDRLCAGETEDEFAERLAKAIWAANAGYCNVEVTATYLENLPCETYSFDEADYQKLVTAPGSESSA